MPGWNLTDLADVPSNGMRVMSTFACGGGSSMGYKLAGFDVIAANDIDPEMAWHYKANLNPKHYFLGPIGDLVGKDLPKDLDDLDILDGSPPCSTFSMSGLRDKAWGKEKHFREGQAAQVLDDLFFDFLDLADQLRPRAIIAENVKGLVRGKAKGYVRAIFARLRGMGYRPQVFLVDASRCGVPQRRERVFVCALRDDQDRKPLALAPRSAVVTAGEALADVAPTDAERQQESVRLSPRNEEVWPHTRPGEAFSDALVRRGAKASLFSHKKLSRARPSNTLTVAVPKFYHWSEPRSLTYREWKRLGTFPDDYAAKTPAVGQYMIGMSVPPFMARYVAEQVRDQWLT